MQFTISEPYHSTSIERGESCYSFHFYQFSRSFQHRTKDLSCQCFPLSHHSRCDTSISFSPVSSLRHPVTQKQKARSKKLAAFTTPSFATIFLPLSPLFLPPRPSPIIPIASPSTSRGTFSQQRFSAFDICDLNFRYREFPRAEVPLDCTLSDTTRSQLFLSLSCPRVTLSFSLLSFSHSPPTLVSLVYCRRSSWASRRDSAPENAGTRVHGFKVDRSIDLLSARWGINDATGGHASARCFACELVLLVCCALIRQAYGWTGEAREHHLDALRFDILLCPNARCTPHWDFPERDKRVSLDPRCIEIWILRNVMRISFFFFFSFLFAEITRSFRRLPTF